MKKIAPKKTSSVPSGQTRARNWRVTPGTYTGRDPQNQSDRSGTRSERRGPQTYVYGGNVTSFPVNGTAEAGSFVTLSVTDPGFTRGHHRGSA